MTEPISVSSANAAGGVGQNAIFYSLLVPGCAGFGGIDYLTLDAVEIWAATTNNRNNASMVGEASSWPAGQFAHTGLSPSVTRFYWLRARNNAGDHGPWFPESATGGLSATTLTTVPPPNSVGTNELQNGAVTDAKVSSINANKINATSLSAISANLGTVTAGTVTGVTITGGLIRTSSGNTRIELNGATNNLSSYVNGILVARIGTVQGSSEARSLFLGEFNNQLAVSAIGGGGTNGHGLRGFGGQFSGGRGIVGVSSTSGGWAFYAESGGYGPFTGAHPGMLLHDDEAVPGDIVCDVKVLAREGISDTLTEVARSSEADQRNVIGVLESRRPFEQNTLLNVETSPQKRAAWVKKYDLATINALGEGQINVCGRNGDIAAGDYITTSTMPGKGQRQDDDIKRSCTVARAREAVSFSHPDQVKCVSCFYDCG